MIPLLAIDTKDLTKDFRQNRSRPGLAGAFRDLFDRQHSTLRAVDKVTLQISPGEIAGYIGANGSGKSTTIKMLTGILHPTAGTVRVNGYDPHGPDAMAFRHTIGVVFGQRSQLWWDIAVQESFRLLQRIYRVSDSDYRAFFLGSVVEVLGIGELLATPVRKLSLGQRMRCELAAALLHRPKLLFLDEPTIGLDVSVKLRIRDFLKEMNRREGTTILLTTHDLSDIEALCRQVVMLHKGQLVYNGTLTELRRYAAQDRSVRVVFADAVNIADGLGTRPVEAVDATTYRIKLGEEENLSELLGALLALGPVRDITVVEASMEEIVRNMYEAGGMPA